MPHWVSKVEALPDFLMFVAMHAPASFPKEDFLADDEQMTLAKAFEEIDRGLQLIAQRPHRVAESKRVAKARADIDAAREAFRTGDDRKGCLLLQDAHHSLVGKKKGSRED